MFKKIVLFALLLIPMGMVAQESLKIAHVNFTEVMLAMPETTIMQDSLKKQTAAFESELKAYNDEFQKKYVAYLQQRDTLVESIRVRREKDLEDIRERTGNFQQQAEQTLQKLQGDLLRPIQEKVNNAVKAVGEENGFAYIFEMGSGAVAYASPKSTDATPLVRKKLGLK